MVRDNFKDKSVYFNFSMPPEIVEGIEDKNIIREINNGSYKSEDKQEICSLEMLTRCFFLFVCLLVCFIILFKNLN